MHPGWEIHPHPSGPWLLRAGSRHFLLPPEIGRQLLDPDSAPQRQDLAAALQEAALTPHSGWMWLRVPLLPRSWVGVLGRRLAPLCPYSWLLAQGLGGLALAVWSLARGLPQLELTGLPPLPTVLILFLASALWHELGHAAALAREGYPPGRIGLGLLLVFPVLYADVTAVAALARSGRTRVNLAGICFQLGCAGLIGLTGWLQSRAGSGWPAWALLTTASILGAVAWSVTPFFRSDGYWLAVDLLGLPDLEQPLDRSDQTRSPGRRRLLAAGLVTYRLLHSAFLASIGYFLPVRLGARFALLLSWLPPGPASAATRAAGLALVLLLWLGLGLRIRALLRSCWLDLQVALDYYPGRRKSDEILSDATDGEQGDAPESPGPRPAG